LYLLRGLNKKNVENADISHQLKTGLQVLTSQLIVLQFEQNSNVLRLNQPSHALSRNRMEQFLKGQFLQFTNFVNISNLLLSGHQHQEINQCN